MPRGCASPAKRCCLRRRSHASFLARQIPLLCAADLDLLLLRQLCGVSLRRGRLPVGLRLAHQPLEVDLCELGQERAQPLGLHGGDGAHEAMRDRAADELCVEHPLTARTVQRAPSFRLDQHVLANDQPPTARATHPRALHVEAGAQRSQQRLLARALAARLSLPRAAPGLVAQADAAGAQLVAELAADVAGLAERAVVDVIGLAPLWAASILLPLAVDVQERQVVAGGVHETRLRLCGDPHLLRALPRRVEPDALRTQYRHERQRVSSATQLLRGQQGPRELRLEREP
mmetsp:Transcript_97012/g.296509  ORF Transcript_97012/g.296509 Transcript_97012/m.296509 type:complete len:289 (-) Transcript_97012:1382-2248(-)